LQIIIVLSVILRHYVETTVNYKKLNFIYVFKNSIYSNDVNILEIFVYYTILI